MMSQPSGEWVSTTKRARELRAAQTAAERRFWELVRDRRIDGFKFRRQHRLGAFITDFYCAERRLVVEIDGGVHEGQREYDAARTAAINTMHLRLIRFTNDELSSSPDEVRNRLRQVLVERERDIRHW